MKLGSLMALNAIISLVFGLAVLVAPTDLLSTSYHLTTPSALLAVHYLGAALVGYAVLLWLSRNMNGEARRAIVPALLASHVLGFLVGVWGQLSSALSTLGWGAVLLSLLFALGYAYFQFGQPRNA